MTETGLTEAPDGTLSQAEIAERSSKLRQSLIDSLSRKPIYIKAAVESDVLGKNNVEWDENGITYRLKNNSILANGILRKTTEIAVDTPDSRKYTDIPWRRRPGRVTFTDIHTDPPYWRSTESGFRSKAPAPEDSVYTNSAKAFEIAGAMLAPLLTKKG